ncbi:hypothetical protein DPEC_G00147190 [Dallia pectoralis]|uniref:Uncharacterized protein n=1 Tax=Dallia pectoralis TaxID=75939 RepID=A0ACC2GHV1_DALPE|nr:hypothetical protein DPEC_G00147190 [Dallia pectoralis]
MANNCPNVTLSLTLPISCQICLGKVRQPVICTNNHVFCSGCMDIWLKKAGQCPTCRIPITADNPCREIIGGTNENESNESHSVKKRLRKTRGELLLREYEDEIEGLLKENEDLRNRNQNLDSQLKSVLNPCTITASQQEDQSIDPTLLEEWRKKMRAASDCYSKVKLDLDKVKEANKMLRSQNIDLVQENMRLKAEVASRSPQKFGRCTVAALEAKIQHYQRDVEHLNKALERSDRYIEELEAHGGVAGHLTQDLQGRTDARGESSSSGEEEARTREQQIRALRRSLGDMENAPLCTTSLEGESQTLSAHHNYLLATGLGAADTYLDHRVGEMVKDSMDTDSIGLVAPSELFLPSTPSSAFRSLSLMSPGGSDDRKLGRKALAYLRRLSFEDCGPPSTSASAVEPKCSSVSAPFSNGGFPGSVSEARSSSTETAFWGAAWQSQKPSDLSSVASPNHSGPQQLNSGTSEAGPTTAEDQAEETDPMSSEASMDAAYRDKISELDSMMLEVPDVISRHSSADSHLSSSNLSSGSQLSLTSLRSGNSPDLTIEPGLDVTLVPVVEPVLLGVDSEEGGASCGGEEKDGVDLACRLEGTCSTALTESSAAGSAASATSSSATSSSATSSSATSSSATSSSATSSIATSCSATSCSATSSSATSSSATSSSATSSSATSSSATSSSATFSQPDELSFHLQFDPLTGVKSRQEGALSGRDDEEDGRPVGRERSVAKRKSHSPSNNSSPSKHSKFM